MAGRLGHIDGSRRVGHIPRNGIRKLEYYFGFSARHIFLASKGHNASTNGATIDYWTDSVSGDVFIKGATAPTLIQSDTDYNNFPSIDFGTNARMTSSHGVSGGKDSTVAIVYRRKGSFLVSGNQFSGFLHDGIGLPNTRGLKYGARSSGEGLTWGVGIGSINYSNGYNVSIADTNPHIFIFSGFGFYLDGVDVTGSAAGGTALNNWITNGLMDAMGGPSGLAYSIADLAILDDNLTLAEMDELSFLINSKYAIY